MKIKFCGVCRPEDAAAAQRAGADYIGVILSGGFPRSQPLEKAAEIYAAAPNTQHVGVFVDATLPELANAAKKLRLDVLQLHGNETPDRVVSDPRA